MSILQRWGLGVELVFNAGRAVANMGRAQSAVSSLRSAFRSMAGDVSGIASGIGTLTAALAPLGAAVGFVGVKASGLVALGDIFTEFGPSFAAGVSGMLRGVLSAWDTVGRPIFDGIVGALRGLGDEGRARLFGLAALLAGPVLSGLLAFGGALIAGGIALGALGSIAGGIFGILSTVFGLIAAPEAVLVLGLVTAGVSALGAALLSVGTVLGAAGAGGALDRWLVTLGDLGALIGGFVAGAGAVALAFFKGVGVQLERISVVAYARLFPAAEALRVAFGALIYQVRDTGISAGELAAGGGFLASVLGGVLDFAVGAVAVGLETTTGIVTVLLPLLVEVAKVARRVGEAFFGWASGSMSAVGAIKLLALTAGQVLLSAVRVLIDAILGDVGDAIGALGAFIGGLPGGGALGAAIGQGQVQLDRVRVGIDSGIDRSLAELDQSARALERRRAAPVVNVSPEVKAAVDVQTSVKVDGAEVARAAGAAAVRAGERGQGPALPAEQRGRVLRTGLQVTPLAPAEVL